MTPFRVFVLSLAAFPAFCLAAFYNYVLAARLYLGYWPQYNRPDPKRLGWWFPHDLLWLGIIYFPIYFPCVAVLTLCLIGFGNRRSQEFPTGMAVAILFGSFATLIACVLLDPGGFFEWFFD